MPLNNSLMGEHEETHVGWRMISGWWKVKRKMENIGRSYMAEGMGKVLGKSKSV